MTTNQGLQFPAEAVCVTVPLPFSPQRRRHAYMVDLNCQEVDDGNDDSGRAPQPCQLVICAGDSLNPTTTSRAVSKAQYARCMPNTLRPLMADDEGFVQYNSQTPATYTFFLKISKG